MDEKKTISQCHCLKCGYDWWPKSPDRPAVCSKCKNPRWDEGPKKVGGKGRTKEMSDAESIKGKK